MEAVLLNILDPNRTVEPRYLTYVVVTTQGKIHTGMITGETANGLTLRRPDGQEVSLMRTEIEHLRSTGLSFMPEGLEQQVDLDAMADLLAYLDSIK
jgi:putative heme-binding domain-containing protein